MAAVEETERGYGGIIRQSLGVAEGFPWNVLSGSLEYGGLGALQLATEVTTARLRQFQSMLTSSAAADCSVAMAMVSLAQRLRLIMCNRKALSKRRNESRPNGQLYDATYIGRFYMIRA